jgi:hypothetical protein
MKRGGFIKRKTPMRRVSPKRAIERRTYSALRKQYLAEHPWCELIPTLRATQIHHKNKCRGARLNDTSEWMAISYAGHRLIEDNKGWARANGYLRDF